MLDCKHVGPSLPPWLFCGRGLGPHSKLGAGGREASIGIGLEGSRSRVLPVWEGERGLEHCGLLSTAGRS